MRLSVDRACCQHRLNDFNRQIGRRSRTKRRNFAILGAFPPPPKESWKSVIVLIDHGLLDPTSLTKVCTYIYTRIYSLKRVASIRFLSYPLIVIEIDYRSSSFRGEREGCAQRKGGRMRVSIMKLPRSKVIR